MRLLPFIILIASAPALAHPDDSAINALYDRIGAAKSDNDATAWVGSFAPGALIDDSRARAAANDQELKAIVTPMTERLRREGGAITVQYRVARRTVSGDTAVDSGLMRQVVTAPAADPRPIIMRFLVTLQRQPDGVWRILGDAAFSATVRLPDGAQSSLDRFYDDGTHSDRTAGDGNFTRLFVDTSQTGTYQIQITGWKGVVPVEQSTNVEVVEFPVLVLDQPHNRVEVQGQPVTIQAHLQGGNPTAIRQGEVLMRISAPSGKGQEIVLSAAQGRYTGKFIPVENGRYDILAETRGATYFGAPFWSAAQGEFDAHIVRAIAIGKPDAQISSSCFNGVERISVHLPVTSIQPETIAFALDGLSGFVLRPESVTLRPGTQTTALEFLPSGGGKPAGTYRTNLTVRGGAEASITPGTIPIELDLPSPWVRCHSEITWSGLALFFASIAGVVTIHRIRRAAAPLLVTGTLRYWPEGTPLAEAKEHDLTALRMDRLTLGRKPDCNLVFPESGLEEIHAVLAAERAASVYLEPLGAVRKGYQTTRVRFPLKHAEVFSMGGLNFQYLSDSGE